MIYELNNLNKPIDLTKGSVDGRVPPAFYSYRCETIDVFFSLLFRDPDPLRFVFIRAPPLSGKSGLCDLMYNRILNCKDSSINVLRVLCNKLDKLKLKDYLKSKLSIDLDTFCGLQGIQVLLLDEAQITYNDSDLWTGLFKNTMEGDQDYRNMRIVLFSSYGSFDMFREEERSGTPISIKPSHIFGLSVPPSKASLQLKFNEFMEMVKDSEVGCKVHELVWYLSSGHIGIAGAILHFLRVKFGTKDEKIENLESELRSSNLLDYIRSYYRGIPTLEAFQKVLENQKRASELRIRKDNGNNLQCIECIEKSNNDIDALKLKMSTIMNDVALGEVILVSNGDRTPRSRRAVELLTRFGFLYEDEHGQLHFASQVHLKIWLRSTRTDPMYHLMTNLASDDFLVACLQRMNASRLQQFADENSNDVARERQIQMELYKATISCLSKEVLVTPEWRTSDGKGFIDLVIRSNDIMWFWELLVNGDEAISHAKRFERGGKYYESLTQHSKYVLIDFRQNKGVKKQRKDFLYVSFTDSFKQAKIFGPGQSEIQVDLSIE